MATKMIAGLTVAEYHRCWRKDRGKEHTYAVWKSQIKRRYGFTEGRYFEMWYQQDGLCAICGQLPQGQDLKLCVDHDHKTGQARELLCRGCNIIVGSLESPLYDKAKDYLRRYQ